MNATQGRISGQYSIKKSPQYAHAGTSVMKGSENIATARSRNTATLIVNALNSYKPTRRGT